MKKIFSISGKVIKGKDKGKQLGYPTANIKLPKSHQIESGVYAVKVEVGDKILNGAAFIRPQSRPQSQILEVHLFDFSGNLYGKELKVDFFKKLREARKFKNDKQLMAQIGKDCKLARQFLKSM